MTIKYLEPRKEEEVVDEKKETKSTSK